MVVQHNISAMTANRYYTNNNSALGKSMEKLSSGLAINRAGDNAAGLAVSEKMRAQISGLTQASKNAQDGISMVQTFEGALQETDSILQRMRTLAVQSANGSYANEVDREAIQLEFDQLNDELNQIADTDYNGVVVLNGGEMADGVTADPNTGKIDYAAKTASDAATAKANERLTALNRLASADDKDLVESAEDFCGDTAGAIVDNANYGKTDADAIWNALGLEAESTDTANPDELNITFTYDGSAWKASGVTDKDGKEIEVEESKLAALETTSNGNGGFSINGTSLNLVFDTSDVQKYDTATVTVQNLKGASSKPDNAGILEDSWDTSGITAGAAPAAATVALAITDANNMDQNMKDALDALQGAEVTLTYAAGNPPAAGATTTVATTAGVAVTGASNSNLKLYSSVSGNDTTISYSVDNGTTKIDLVKITAGAGDGSTTAGAAKFNLNFDSYDFISGDDLTAKTSATSDAMKTKVGAEDDKEPVAVSNAYGNGQRSLTYAQSMSLQTGARSKDLVEFTFKYSTDAMGSGDDKLGADMDCSARGLKTDKIDLKTQENANAAIDKIDNAINKVSMVRATFGAIQNRLEHKISNLDTNAENITAAESRIRDTQMDQEMMKFTSAQILSQASQSMLAQANSLPQGVLQLLG